MFSYHKLRILFIACLPALSLQAVPTIDIHATLSIQFVQQIPTIQIPEVIDEQTMLANSFPKDFIWGSGGAAYQYWGRDILKNAQWAPYEDGSGWILPHIDNNDRSGDGNGNFTRNIQDIQLAKNLGVNSDRFSIDWSFIEPEEGKFNHNAIEYYKNHCQELIAQGMTPMATLHHFVHPQWFEAKGGFEKVENIKYFLKFAARAFAELNPYINLWATFNEPGVFAFAGYYRGVFPPGKQDAALTGKVLRNLMIAHVYTYRMLKKMPGGDTAQIGLVHQFLTSEATSSYAVHMKDLADVMNMCFHTAIFNFLKTGIFDFKVDSLYTFLLDKKTAATFGPAKLYDKTIITPGEKIFDWIGVNYYTKNLFGFGGATCNPENGEYMTDMPYRAYPQGLYEMIHEASTLGVPMYVTENGCPDIKDTHREEWIQTHLYAVAQALKDGYDVRGFYYWSLLDNFEWDMGWNQKFGLYHVDLVTKVRTLRKGSEAYARIIALNRPTSGATVEERVVPLEATAQTEVAA